MNGGDVTDHIAKVLKIIEWIKMPNVEKNELRLHVLSKSLSGDAETWWNNEINGTTITWNAQEAKDIYEVINRDYSTIPIPARRDIDNPDELCKTKEFTVHDLHLPRTLQQKRSRMGSNTEEMNEGGKRNSSSWSPENYHTIIESLPTSTTLVKDSDSNREKIDIISGPDDSIPLGIESDFDSEEDIIDNLLNDDPIPEYKCLTFDMEPYVLVISNVNEDECFDPGGGEINVEVNDSFTFVTRTFLPYLTYPEVSPLLSSTKNEDTIFDPDIST
ncbi:hypothetical protein Tco_0281217 [Tanacetum coccineum]